MDFKKLETQFKAFIEKEQKNDAVGKKKLLEKDDTSIFANHDDVNKFIDKQYGFNAEDMTMDLKDLLNMDVKEGQFVDTGEFDIDDIELEEGEEVEEGEQTEGLSDAAKKNIGASMVEVINDMLKDEDVQNVVDKNGDGEITKSEIKTFLETAAGIDGKEADISLEDILSSVDAVKNAQIEEAEEADEAEEVDDDVDEAEIAVPEASEDIGTQNIGETAGNDAVQNAGGASGGGGVSGGGGGSYGGGGGGVSGGSSPTVSNSSNPAAASTGSLDSMNLEELNKELDTRNSTLSEKQEELSKANSGETDELKNLKDKEDEAYKEYLEQMKEDAPALSDALRQVRADMEKEEQAISEADNEINTQTAAIDEAQANIDNAESRISSLDSAIATAKSNLSSVEDDSKKASIQSQIEAYEADKKAAEADKKQAENDKKTAEDAKAKAEEDKQTHEEELERLQGEMDKIQQEVEENEELSDVKEKQEAYNEAKQEYETAKTNAVSEAKSAVTEAQKAVKEIQDKITEVQSKAIEASAKLTSLSGKYNKNGAEYNTILDQADLDALAKAAANGGAGTGFGHPDKCLSIAFSYGLWATGDSNRAYGDSGVWKYGDNGAYSRFYNDSKDVVLAEIKKELDEGRPCVLQVNGSSQNSRHYVTVVGYKSSAGDKLDESDLLIWDTYDSTIRDCGQNSSGHRNMIQGYATCHGGYGWEIYKRKS